MALSTISLTSHLYPFHDFHPSSITTLFLPAHHQNCTINFYFHLSPSIGGFSWTRAPKTLQTFPGTGEVWARPVMSMHLFYTRETAFSHILTLTHFGDLQHHSDSFSISTSSNSEMSCTHLHHLRTFITCPHITHQHISEYSTIVHTCITCCQNLRSSAETHPFTFQSYSRYIISHIRTYSCTKAHLRRISSIIHTRHAEYLQNLRKHLDTGSFNSTAFIMLWYASPNISIASGRASSLFPVSILPHQIGIFCLFFKILALTSDQLSSTAIPHLHSPK